MKHIVLVDSENIAITKESISELDSSIEIVFFVSDASKYLNLMVFKELVERNIKCSFETVYNSNRTKNCMDFHIVAYLGMLRKQDAHYYILSNDKGYEAVTSYIGNKKRTNIELVSTLNDVMHLIKGISPKDEHVTHLVGCQEELELPSVLNSMDESVSSSKNCTLPTHFNGGYRLDPEMTKSLLGDLETYATPKEAFNAIYTTFKDKVSTVTMSILFIQNLHTLVPNYSMPEVNREETSLSLAEKKAIAMRHIVDAEDEEDFVYTICMHGVNCIGKREAIGIVLRYLPQFYNLKTTCKQKHDCLNIV